MTTRNVNSPHLGLGTLEVMALRPDGLQAATAGAASLVLWDLPTRKPQRVLPGARFNALSYSPDGRLLAATEAFQSRGSLVVRVSATGEVLHRVEGQFHQASFSPDGRLVAVMDYATRMVVLIDPAAGTVHPLERNLDLNLVSCLAWSRDGQVLLGSMNGDRDPWVFAWDIASGRLLQPLKCHKATPPTVSFGPDGLVASGLRARVGNLVIWSLRTGKTRRTLSCREQVTAVAWSPDGRQIAASGLSPDIWLWDVASGEQIGTLSGHRGGGVMQLAWAADSRLLASRSLVDGVRLWDAPALQEIGQLRGHTATVTSSARHPHLPIVATAHTVDSVVRLWDTTRGVQLDERSTVWEAQVVAWSPDGETLAVGQRWHEAPAGLVGSGGTLRLLTLEGEALVERATVTEPVAPFFLLAWSPDGALLAVPAGPDVTLRRRSDGQVAQTLSREDTRRDFQAWATALAWGPAGLAVGTRDGLLWVWQAEAGVSLLLANPGPEITALAWGPDGITLASADRDGTVTFWEGEAVTRAAMVRLGESPARRMVWFDGTHLVALLHDGTVWRCDRATSRRILPDAGFTTALDADGRRDMVVGGRDGVTRVVRDL